MHENAAANIVCEMGSILSGGWGRCVKRVLLFTTVRHIFIVVLMHHIYYDFFMSYLVQADEI